MSWKISGSEDFFREDNKRVYSFIRDLKVVTKVYEKRHEENMSGLFWKMTIKDSIATSYWVFTHLYIHLAAPWRRMPVVLKEDLGLSSLGLTGSRGMLQYGVAFMKIISRRSNDRLFDNPICGETYMTCKGPSLYYVRVFWGFFEPPVHLRKDIFTT